jgi:peptidoglycan hydrolase-like protein with peptidoglycan-binding domain
MGALLSMDTFRLLSAQGGRPEIRAMQQRLNRRYESHTGLMPCDGIYAANTNRALIRSMQAEMGLPASLASNNYGATSRTHTPQIPYVRNSTAAKQYSGGAFYTNEQISMFTEMLQFALFVNGFGNGIMDGVFSSRTQQDLLDFQRHHELPATGTADLRTWWSLLTSNGDPSRLAVGADTSTKIDVPKARTLYDQGYRIVGRYLTNLPGGMDKAITREEAEILFNNGLRFFPIFQEQYIPIMASYFTEAQGVIDAEKAIVASMRLGIPRDTIIYFAVDFDVMDHEITSNIIPYFRAISQRMSTSIYRVGIYGPRNACIRVGNAGHSVSSFVSNMSAGFSGNLGFRMPNDWAFDQFIELYIGEGDGRIGIDRNAVSGCDQGVSHLDESDVIYPGIESLNYALGSAGGDTVHGPTVNILGYEFPLFVLNIELNTPFGDMVTTHYNAREQTYEIIIGLKTDEVIDTPANNDSYWQQQYGEIKQLLNALGRNTDQAFYNKFRRMRSTLRSANMNFAFDYSTYCFGAIKFDMSTGTPRLIEGGVGIIAEVKTSLSYPLPVPCVYVKLQLEGSLETGFRLVLEDAGQLSARGNFKVATRLSLGVEANIVAAKVYAGISGGLEANFIIPITSFLECLEVHINASLFFEWRALFWGNRYDWVFANAQLYPLSPSGASMEGTFSQPLTVPLNAMEFIPPLPSSISAYNAVPGVFRENVQMYCAPQIISLGNGNLFMVYIDDALNRSDENRSVLMHSVFSGTTWSTPMPVLDNGTVDFEPRIYPDGNGGAHIIWQNGTEIFSPGVTLDEMATKVDLHYIHWNGSSFNGSSSITNNNYLPTHYRIISSGNNISVVWQQNTENDPFALTGTNSIHLRQFTNGSWQNIQEIVSGLPIITSMDVTYINNTAVIAYTVKTNNDLSTINDLELFYYNGTTISRLTNDNIPDYSVSFLGNELYWISGRSLMSITNGNMNAPITVVEDLGVGVSEIKAVGSVSGHRAIVWADESGVGTSLFYTRYNAADGTFGNAHPLVADNGIIRGWDATMLPSGQIETAYCFAEIEPANGRPYGRLDLFQKTVAGFYDISVNPIIAYDGEIAANQKITLFADVFNSGSLPVSRFTVNIISGSSVQKLTINQDLPVGEVIELEIPFTLPAAISRSEYSVEILPGDGSDFSLSDNRGFFTFGYADLAFGYIQEVRTASGRRLTVNIINQGFDVISAGTFYVFTESFDGEILDTKTFEQLSPGATVTFTFDINESDLDSAISENPRLFCLLLETPDDESDYGNNSELVYIYPDYSVLLTANAGGTVEGSGKYEYESLVTVSAHPNPGYVFDVWTENGQILHNVPSVYEFNVNSNRTLTATFKPNNLAITNIEVFNSIEGRTPTVFTATASGGVHPLQWSFSVYTGEAVHYSVNDSAFNFFEWTPSALGNYYVKAHCTDATGQSTEHIITFNVLIIPPSLRDKLADFITKAQGLLNNTAVSANGIGVPINEFWATQETHNNLHEAILEAIRVLEDYDEQT